MWRIRRYKRSRSPPGAENLDGVARRVQRSDRRPFGMAMGMRNEGIVATQTAQSLCRKTPNCHSFAMANVPPAEIFFPSARMLTQPPCHVSTYPLMCFLTDFAHLSRAWPSILPFCRVRGGNGVHQHQAASERRCGLQRSSNGISSPSCASGVIFRPSASRRHPLHRSLFGMV